MPSSLQTAVVRWHVFATQRGIFLNLNGTPVFVCSHPAQMGNGFTKHGQVDIPITLKLRRSVNLSTQAEIADQQRALGIKPSTLKVVPAAPLSAELYPLFNSDEPAPKDRAQYPPGLVRKEQV